MTRLVFATKRQAEVALEGLTSTMESIKSGRLSLRNAEKHLRNVSGVRSFSRSALQRWLRSPLPLIGKSKCGFCLLNSGHHPSTSLQHEEEERLIALIKERFASKRLIEIAELQTLARALAEEIIADNPLEEQNYAPANSLGTGFLASFRVTARRFPAL